MSETTFVVGEGLTVTSTVVGRACAVAALECPGVVILQPGMASIAQGMLRRAGELLAGRSAAGPLDGVEVTGGDDGRAWVSLIIGVAGRPAADVARDLLAELPERVHQLSGVLPARVRVRVTDIVPSADEHVDG